MNKSGWRRTMLIGMFLGLALAPGWGSALAGEEAFRAPTSEELAKSQALYQDAKAAFSAGDQKKAVAGYSELIESYSHTPPGRKAQFMVIWSYLGDGRLKDAAVQSVKWFLKFFLHLDKYLNDIVADFKTWTYLLLLVIIFGETGLVVTPILPGDSLLFAAGALAAAEGSPLNPLWLWLLLSAAAVAGDTVNYWIGHLAGPRVFTQEKSRFFKKEYLTRTHNFYEKYGPVTIIIARFIPIIRTFAPFVAGIGEMAYLKFITYNVVGGVAWITLFIFGGYFFGNIPLVKNNFSFVIIAIVIISIMPPIIEYLRQRFGKEKSSK